MATITRAQFPLLLEPKLRNIWNNEWPEWATEYTRYVNVGTSKKAQETDYKMAGLGDLVSITEGGEVSFDNPLSGPTKVYTHTQTGLGYKITDMMLRHELYGQMERLERSLMRAVRHKIESDCADILNNAFSGTGGFSSEALIATSHVRLDGGTAQSNRPSTDVNLGVASLQNALIQFDLWKDDRGRPYKSIPKLLIIHPQDKMVARELLGSQYKPGTANNEINALVQDDLTFMVSHYLTDTNAWFVEGDTHDINLIWDLKPTISMDTEFKTDSLLRKVKQSYSTGNGEWRGVYGSSGTT